MNAFRPGTRLLAGLCATLLLGAQTQLTTQQLQAITAAAIRIKHADQAITVGADGRTVSVATMQVQLLNALAVRAAQFPVPYNATLEDIEITEAYTLKADGRKLPVDPSVILTQRPAATSSLEPVYSDREQKVIIFPDAQVGDTLVFTSKTTQKAPLMPGQFTLARSIDDAAPIEDSVYTVTAPAGMALRFDASWPQETSRQGELVTYRWHRSAPPAPPRAAPPIFDIGKTQHLLVSSFADYDAFAHDYAAMVRGKIVVTPAIQKQADTIAANAGDRRAQARAIYEWVSRNVRYVGIELGAGGIVPHDPDWTLNNRFGDCKDHAVLFASLLKARGIDAQLVLIHAGNHYKLGGVPTISDFNHMIAWLPELKLYADTTTAYIPFGQLPNGDAGKPVLHVVESGAARHQTPVVPEGALNATYTVRAVMNEQGVMIVDAATRATGAWASTLRRFDDGVRSLGSDLTAKQLLTQHNFPNATGTLLPGSGDGDSYEVSGTARLGRPSPQTSLLTTANALYVLSRPGDGLMGPLNNRAITDADDTPCLSGHQSEEIAITFRPGTRPEALPAEMHLKTANLSYDTHWSADGDTVTLRREFVSKMTEPVCTGAIRRETAEALSRIRADYAVPLRQAGASVPSTPPPATPAASQ